MKQLVSLTSEVENKNKIKAVLETIGNARVETFYSVIRDYLTSKDPQNFKRSDFKCFQNTRSSIYRSYNFTFIDKRNAT